MTQRYINTGSTPGGNGTTNATTGANRAYASRSEWEAAEQTTLTDNHIATCDGTGADTTTFIIDGWTPGSYTITLEVASASRHPGYYSTSHNRCTYTANGFDQAFLKSYEDNVHIVGHQFGMSSSSGASDAGCVKIGDGAGVYPTGNYIEQNLFEFVTGTTGPCQALRMATTNWSHYISRNIFNGFRNGATNWWSGISEVRGARMYGYRNTFNNCYYGWYGGADDVLKQNIAQSCTDGYANGFHANSDRNLSDLASDAPGTNARNSTTVTFVSSTNLHLASSDTGAIDYGADLSSDADYPISTDIDFVTISGTPDLGADEYVAAGGAIVGTVPVVLTVTGVLTGTGALAGVITTSLSVVGNLSGLGALIGVVTTLLTVTGVLTGIGTLLGVISSQFSVTGALISAASGAITGSITTLLTATGNLTGIGNLLGNSTCSFSLVGLASGVGNLSSGVLVNFTSAGILLGAGYLVGGITLLFGVTGAFYSPGSGDMLGYISFRDGYIVGKVKFFQPQLSCCDLISIINE